MTFLCYDALLRTVPTQISSWKGYRTGQRHTFGRKIVQCRPGLSLLLVYIALQNPAILPSARSLSPRPLSIQSFYTFSMAGIKNNTHPSRQNKVLKTITAGAPPPRCSISRSYKAVSFLERDLRLVGKYARIG